MDSSGNGGDGEGSISIDTFMNSKDFSLTSLISDLSQRLGSNSSSSFLFHVDVDDDGKSTGADDGCVGEILRQMSMSGLDECAGGGRSSSFKAPSSIVEEEGTENDQNADSWSEFDKALEKSLGSRSTVWERSRSRRSTLESEGGFRSAEEARVELDMEEEERARFCQSVNASLPFTPSMCSSLLNPSRPSENMSQYFMGRSSFPVGKCANESTMLLQEGVSLEDGGYASQDKTLTPRNSTVAVTSDGASKYSLTPLQCSKAGKENPLIGILTPSSVKSIAKHILSEMPNAKEEDRKKLIDFILKQCRLSMGKRQSKTGSSPPTKLTTVSETETQEVGKERGYRMSHSTLPMRNGAYQTATHPGLTDTRGRSRSQGNIQQHSGFGNGKSAFTNVPVHQHQHRRPAFTVHPHADAPTLAKSSLGAHISKSKPAAHRDPDPVFRRSQSFRHATNTTTATLDKRRSSSKEKMKRPTPVYPAYNGTQAHITHAAAPSTAAHHFPYGHGPIGDPPNVQVRNYYYFPPGQPVHLHTHHAAPHPSSVPEPNEQQQTHRHHP